MGLFLLRSNQRRLQLLLPSLVLFLSACSPGRPPLPPGDIPKAQPPSVSEEQYGHQVLEALTQRFPLDYDHPRHQNVEDIVDKLTGAARADQDPWHVYIFKDASFKNAAATRGNHVFVWTAMIDATRNDDELSAVLAHEISHVLARHTDPDPNEEVRKILINVGAMAVGIAAAAALDSPQFGQTAGDLASQVTGELGKGLFLNPYSRDREFEADQIGLFLMADAGYDPQAAVDFWNRAQGDPSFGSSLEFFSTHPPAGDRLVRLQQLLPDAKARFERRVPPREPVDLSALGSGKTSRSAPAERSSVGSPMPPDSFDVSKSAGGSLLRAGESWIVVADRAVLYAERTLSGHALGEFTKGAKVQVVERSGEWLKIEKPDAGYLRKADLSLAQ